MSIFSKSNVNAVRDAYPKAEAPAASSVNAPDDSLPDITPNG